MSISFFSPIHSGSAFNPQEKCSFLRGAVQLFDFGQKAYAIKHYDGSTVNVIEVEGSNPSWMGTLLRIIAIATLVLPLIMLIGTCIYRALNTFQVADKTKSEDQSSDSSPDVPGRDELTTLPEDILKIIFKESDPSVLQLASTCRGSKAFIEKETPLQGHKTVLYALEKAYNLAKTVEEA